MSPADQGGRPIAANVDRFRVVEEDVARSSAVFEEGDDGAVEQLGPLHSAILPWLRAMRCRPRPRSGTCRSHRAPDPSTDTRRAVRFGGPIRSSIGCDEPLSRTPEGPGDASWKESCGGL